MWRNRLINLGFSRISELKYQYNIFEIECIKDDSYVYRVDLNHIEDVDLNINKIYLQSVMERFSSTSFLDFYDDFTLLGSVNHSIQPVRILDKSTNMRYLVNDNGITVECSNRFIPCNKFELYKTLLDVV